MRVQRRGRPQRLAVSRACLSPSPFGATAATDKRRADKASRSHSGPLPMSRTALVLAAWPGSSGFPSVWQRNRLSPTTRRPGSRLAAMRTSRISLTLSARPCPEGASFPCRRHGPARTDFPPLPELWPLRDPVQRAARPRRARRLPPLGNPDECFRTGYHQMGATAMTRGHRPLRRLAVPFDQPPKDDCRAGP